MIPTPGKLVAEPAKIIIEQEPNGAFKLTHNIIKPMFLIGVLSTTLANVVSAAIQQEQMIIDPNRPRVVRVTDETPETPAPPSPENGKVH